MYILFLFFLGVVYIQIRLLSFVVIFASILSRAIKTLREIYEQVSCNSARTISVNHTPSPD